MMTQCSLCMTPVVQEITGIRAQFCKQSQRTTLKENNQNEYLRYTAQINTAK